MEKSTFMKMDIENIWQKHIKVENEILFPKTSEDQVDQMQTSSLSPVLECNLAHHFDLLESGTLVLLQTERNVSENLKDTSGENDEEDFHGFHPNEVPLRKVIRIPENDFHDVIEDNTDFEEIKSEPSESDEFEFVDVLQLVKEPGDKNNLNSNEHTKDDLKRKIEQLKEENKRLKESEKMNAEIQETMTNILKISSELIPRIKNRNQIELMNFEEISGLARESEMIKFYHGPLRVKRKRLLLSNSKKVRNFLSNRLCELKDSEREKFSCDICGKTFPSNDLNLAHMISTHTKTCRVSVQDYRKVKKSIATQTGVDSLEEENRSKVDLIYKMHTNFVRMVNP